MQISRIHILTESYAVIRKEKMARRRQDEGWAKISRKLASESLWLSEPFTKGQAWVDLILMAQWRTQGKYEAGTVYTSIYALADRWHWSRGKVRRFLGQLQNDTTIEPSSDTTNGTRILLRNWGKYQGQRPSDDTTNDTRDGTHNKNIYKKEKRGAESTQNADAASLGWKTDDPRVPEDYRKDFASFEEYDRWKNR